MQNRYPTLIFFISILFSLIGCQPSPQVVEPIVETASDSEPAEGITLTIGDIGEDPAETAKDYEYLAQYFEESLAEYGVSKIEIRVAPSLNAMIELINNGEVDIYFDSLYPTMIVNEGTGTKLILRQWRKGVSEYNSIIFAKKESGLTDLSDLEGHIVAMDESFSTSGYLLPAALIKQEGLTLTEKANLSTEVKSDEVGYIFSGDDDNTIQWIISDRVTAGAIDYPSFEQDLPEDIKESMIILGKSEMVPRAVVSLRSDLDSDLAAAIESSLTDLENSEEGLAVLASLKTAKFDQFPGGIEPTIERLRAIYNLVVEESIN